ncbi:MAG: hypothetical protein MJ093_03615 [Saccharofermentans sp.]|nr:hypothetical protein [Saccharofermentans sp.]
MLRRQDDNIRTSSGSNKIGKSVVYVICALIIIMSILLDVYFILGIAS